MYIGDYIEDETLHDHPEKRWMGRLQCDLCQSKNSSYFMDAMVPSHRMWGLLCTTCAKKEGVKIGTGLGQCYHGESGLKQVTDTQPD